MFAADSKVASAPVTPPLTAQKADSWKGIIEPVEPFLEGVGSRLTQQVNTFDPAVMPYAEYALNGEGKHLRPALVALSARALGSTPSEAHVTAAVIIEMVHLATLVHDDIMDEGEIRRGRLTLAANWGNEIAVLLGDCLFAQALVLAASFPTTEVCRAVASATNTVCSGEILQTQHRRNFRLAREEYFKVLEMKTAELFALSCDLSAFLSNATPEQRAALHQFGMAFGIAYQLYDDCVDIFGTEAAAGKSLGTDLAKGKLTLPVLLAWERAGAADRALLEEMIADWQHSFSPRMSELLVQYECLPASLGTVHKHLLQARQAIRHLPHAAGMSGLMGLTDYLARQTDALGN